MARPPLVRHSGLATAAAVILGAATCWLIVDHVRARRAEPGDRQRVEALRKAARTSSAKASELAAEYDRQTKNSLRRAGRRKIATAVVILSSVAFLGSAKRLVSQGGMRPPTRERIAAVKAEIARDRADRRARRPCPSHSSGSYERGRAGEPPVLDLSCLDAMVAEHGRSAEAAVPILQAVQAHYGYLPDEALKRICELTEITPAQIAGVSTFYARFRRSPPGRHIVKVCHGTACHVSGATQITDGIRRHLVIAADADTDPDRMFTVDKVACLGCCSLAPVIMIDEQTVGRLTPAGACEAIEAFREEAAPA